MYLVKNIVNFTYTVSEKLSLFGRICERLESEQFFFIHIIIFYYIHIFISNFLLN